ncbi:MAG: hypothetical protein LHV68_08090 [Elusimicrobia bacterium]|nr:hypothetical protein [Candidatus Liberimonas magnetica]
MFTKEELQESVDTSIKMINAMLDTVKKKKTLEKLASASKAYYDELIKVGFSEEAAIKIVSKFNIIGKQ